MEDQSEGVTSDQTKNRTHSHPQRVYNLGDTQTANEISSYLKQLWMNTMASARAKKGWSDWGEKNIEGFLETFPIISISLLFLFFPSFTICFV